MSDSEPHRRTLRIIIPCTFLYLMFLAIGADAGGVGFGAQGSKRENVFAMREKAQGNESQSKCRNIRHYEKLITTIARRFWCDM